MGAIETLVCRALLVEDNDADARLIQEYLRFAGDYQVIRVATCRDGLRELQQRPPDVALVDLSLPDSHGLATAVSMLQAAPDVPIIVLTGSGDSAIALEAIRAGAQDYLRKNQVDDEVLTRTIRYAVERSRNARALTATQRQLVEASRVAGMAEVAFSVLHNVANALSSVHVSSSVVADTLRSSRLGDLQQLVGLIVAHEADAATFWSGERGNKAAAYLAALVRELSGERAHMLAELAALTSNIDHIKVIVTTQQAHARSTAGITERLDLREVIEDAVRMNRTACERQQIELVTSYASLPMVVLDRHKVIQVLMNLLANARQAVEEGSGERRIRIALARNDGNAATISVTDSGVGITAVNMGRIFAHGFTTKANGHGFGLHSSALAASGLGGSLGCRSDGEGRGATFTLELPLDRIDA